MITPVYGGDQIVEFKITKDGVTTPRTVSVHTPTHRAVEFVLRRIFEDEKPDRIDVTVPSATGDPMTLTLQDPVAYEAGIVG